MYSWDKMDPLEYLRFGACWSAFLTGLVNLVSEVMTTRFAWKLGMDEISDRLQYHEYR